MRALAALGGVATVGAALYGLHTDDLRWIVGAFAAVAVVLVALNAALLVSVGVAGVGFLLILGGEITVGAPTALGGLVSGLLVVAVQRARTR